MLAFDELGDVACWIFEISNTMGVYLLHPFG